MKKLYPFLIGFLVVAVATAGFWLYNNEKSKDTKNSDTSTRSISSTQISSTDNSSKSIENNESKQFLYAGWIPDWGSAEGLESLQKDSKLNTISPVWYDANPDGSLKNKTPKNADEIIKTAKQKGQTILPSIASFDHEILTPILQNPANLNKHINEILAISEKPEFDGIDIDYESTKLSDKDKFFELLKRLSEGLKKQGKLLSVAVLPKWGDEVEYASLRETRKVQDWSEIAKYADQIRIMTYDYVGVGAQFIGPIGPIDWQEEVIKYALTKADSNKFLLGIHLYSYEKFSEVQKADPEGKISYQNELKFQTDFKLAGGGGSSRSYTFDVVSELLKTYNNVEKYQGESILRYQRVNRQTQKTENRILVFIDKDGVNQRIELAKKYNLAGVAFWRIGGESDLLN